MRLAVFTLGYLLAFQAGAAVTLPQNPLLLQRADPFIYRDAQSGLLLLYRHSTGFFCAGDPIQLQPGRVKNGESGAGLAEKSQRTDECQYLGARAAPH